MAGLLQRVLVGLSGGVDSAVAAALLGEAGFAVVGATLRLSAGTAGQDGTEEAAQVASQLGVPHVVLDLAETFERRVVQPFIRAYAAGQTPNPCPACNRSLKLEALAEHAARLECDYIATGHYARTLGAVSPPGLHRLWRGLDEAKDQSYVLYGLRQSQLARLLLPLGSLTKATVRALARDRGLTAAQRAESQDVCFIPGGDYRAFLRRHLPPTSFVPGPIVTGSGEIVGRHGGLALFTVGQRRGLGLARPGPWYVTALRPRENTVVVGPAGELLGTVLLAGEVNFIPFPFPRRPLRALAQTRYRGRSVPAVIAPLSGRRVRVEFDRPQRAIAPGQAVVFYDGDEVLGGGEIAGPSPE